MTFCLIALLWAIYGYSLAFTNGNDVLRRLRPRCSCRGMTTSSVAATFSKGVYIPEFAYFVFQLTFAAITPCLIVGAFAERIKFRAVLLFVVLWFTFAYLPIAHMVWLWAGPDAYTDAAAGAAAARDRGLPVPEGRARLRRRHGRAHQRGYRRPGRRTDDRQAHRLRHGGHAAAQRADGDDRRLAAVGRLVRLQRGLGPRSQRLRRHGVRQHDPRHRGRRAGLVVRRMDPPRHADDARCGLGRRRRPRRDHAGLRLGRPDGRRSRSASSPACSASGGGRASRRSSATTTRSTCSACTASAASWARC